MVGGEKRRRGLMPEIQSLRQITRLGSTCEISLYSGTKKPYTSLNNLYDAVVQSKQKGKAL
jgi:hypothetical protein